MKKFFVLLALLGAIVFEVRIDAAQLSSLSSKMGAVFRGGPAWIGRSFPQGAGAMKFGSYPRFAPGMRTFASLSRKHAPQTPGIGHSAMPAEIASAYRAQARKYHPDNFYNKSEQPQQEATEKFREIKAAYDLLEAPAGSSAEQQEGQGALGMGSVTYGQGAAGVDEFINQEVQKHQAEADQFSPTVSEWKHFLRAGPEDHVNLGGKMWTKFKNPQGILNDPVIGAFMDNDIIVNGRTVHRRSYLTKDGYGLTVVSKISEYSPSVPYGDYVGYQVRHYADGPHTWRFEGPFAREKFDEMHHHRKQAEEHSRNLERWAREDQERAIRRMKEREEEYRREQQQEEWKAASLLGKLKMWWTWSQRPR